MWNINRRFFLTQRNIGLMIVLVMMQPMLSLYGILPFSELLIAFIGSNLFLISAYTLSFFFRHRSYVFSKNVDDLLYRAEESLPHDEELMDLYRRMGGKSKIARGMRSKDAARLWKAVSLLEPQKARITLACYCIGTAFIMWAPVRLLMHLASGSARYGV